MELATRKAQLSPASVNEDARTAEVVWTTGARVTRSSWVDGTYNEELSLDPQHVRMGRLNSGAAPLLANHDGGDLNAVIGVVESARLEKGQGIARVRFAKDDPAAEAVFNKVKQGIVRNVSVGYRVHKFEKIEGGDSKTPTYRATDWEPFEISAVPMGADAQAHFRAEDTKMEVENQQSVDLVEAEKKRVAEIRRAARTAGLTSEVETRMVNNGTSIADARKVALETMAARSEALDIQGQIPAAEHGRIEVGETSSDKFVRGASAWLFERMGNGSPVHKAVELKKRGFEGLELDGGEFRGASLYDLARMSLERRGVRVTSLNKTRVVGDALSFRGNGMQNTASDFSVLLESVLNKVLLGAYETTPDTWSRFCKVDSVVDFRASNRYRLGSFGRLDDLPESAEYKQKQVPDGEKQQLSASAKGNIVAISRKAIINDDMGALSSAASQLGRAARLSIEMDVYDLLNANSGLGANLSDSNPFFYSGRGNVNGAGSALSSAGLDADRVILASQKDPSGNELLDLKPSVLLVPIGLGGQARVITGAKYDPTANTAFEVPNLIYGMVREVVDTARLTDTKRRYLFADPAVCPAITVAFLEGQQAPFLDQRLGWEIDGIEWKCRMEYGVQFQDARGAVTNAGQ